MLDNTRSNILIPDGMDFDGYIYYPYQCIDNNAALKCKLHFSLHGCSEQINGVTGWDHMRRNGLNEYAVTNNLIIVYPQVGYELFKTPCFDFYGGTDKTNYLHSNGIQQSMFMNMIDRLIEPMDSENYDYSDKTNMNDDTQLEVDWKEFWRVFWNFGGISLQWTEINLFGLLAGLFPQEKCSS